MTFAIESEYLVIYRERCKEILKRDPLGDLDKIDFYVSLHFVLEIGLNTIFRRISLNSLKKDVNRFEVIKNLDNIEFIDKAVLFIYNSNFEFGERLPEAAEHHKVIGRMKNFAYMRNAIAHGHSAISTEEERSYLRERLDENLSKQIGLFRSIMTSMRFYLGCLQMPGPLKTDLMRYLDDTFLDPATASKTTS
ncbi:MAG: hypothetical protein P4M11_02485 [Candidatus Pacebacteria bacterium]|nr:hypothetical protein [Candidatus Paceibacterota bacterium]